MSHLLKGKNVLFFSPAFFGYEHEIVLKLEEMGAAVAFYDERSVRAPFQRALLKITPRIFSKHSYDYYMDIINKNRGKKYDYILIIKCDMISEKILDAIKEAFPSAKMCLYMWDSIKNIPDISSKLRYFDHASSFDRSDCRECSGLSFRPLFYLDIFSASADKNRCEKKYDVTFCGTIHSDRLDILNRIEAQCNERGLSFFSFKYLQSVFIYYYYRALYPAFRGKKRSDFSYSQKSLKDVIDIVLMSGAVVDIQHPSQTGLTMRTIETIGLKKKIITTNADVVNYDFYDSANVCIIDRKCPRIETSFLELPYRPISDSIYSRYSLEAWIIDVLNIGG